MADPRDRLTLQDHRLVALLSILSNARIIDARREAMWLDELRECAPNVSNENPTVEPLFDAAKVWLDVGGDDIARMRAAMQSSAALERFFERRAALLKDEIAARLRAPGGQVSQTS